jgi:hypothetical protein
VKAWEAVALSLNVEPTGVKRVDVRRANEVMALRDDKIGRMAKAGLLLDAGRSAYRFDESDDFNARLEAITRNEEALPSVGAPPATEYSADRHVRLSEFGALAISLGWKIPGELTKLARGADITLAEIQSAYDRLRRSTNKPPSQRDVATESGYHRETVKSRWKRVTK